VLPSMPPRSGQVGFLYLPPWRIQGISVAGEETVVHIPEFDIAFDIGLCPRIALPAATVALTHPHMDHVAAMPYYFSQRVFQKLGPGRCVCHPLVVEPLRAMMQSWVDLERQRTPHEIVGIEPDAEIAIKGSTMLRAIEVSHTCPALGYALVERRSKLLPEFVDLPQERLREIKGRGEPITHVIDVPLVAVTGDTEPGPFLYRDEFVEATVVVAECTFFEPDHRSRARIGKHIHVEELAALVKVWKARDIVITHVSRRTTLAYARERLDALLGEDSGRVHLLMDHRANRARYDRQREAAERKEQSSNVASADVDDAGTSP